MKLKKLLSCFLASAIAAGGLVTGNYSFARIDSVTAASYISAPATSDVLRETAYITWTPVADADGYNAVSYTHLYPKLCPLSERNAEHLRWIFQALQAMFQMVFFLFPLPLKEYPVHAP